MFLANGTFWQVGLMSEEGCTMQKFLIRLPPLFPHRGDEDGEFLSPFSPAWLWVSLP